MIRQAVFDCIGAGQGEIEQGLRLVGAHTDSPNLSVKPNPVVGRGGCVQLGVDVYGGALLNPWFDRDLAPGRVTVLVAQDSSNRCCLIRGRQGRGAQLGDSS